MSQPSATVVLFDVSASMQNTFKSSITDNKSNNIQRIKTIFTALTSILRQESSNRNIEDKVYAEVFGLSDDKIDTLDLIHLIIKFNNSPRDMIEIFRQVTQGVNHQMIYNDHPSETLSSFASGRGKRLTARWITDNYVYIKKDFEKAKFIYILAYNTNILDEIEETVTRFGTGKLALLMLAETYDNSNINSHRSWIERSLNEFHSMLLYNAIKNYPEEICQLLYLIPKPVSKNLGIFSSIFADAEAKMVANYIASDVYIHNSQVYLRAQKDIKEYLFPPKRWYLVTDVVAALNKLNDSSSNWTNDFLTVIEGSIYGRTPMCKSMKNAAEMMSENSVRNYHKVLFVLSDGDSTDGDPVPIAETMKSNNIVVTTCYLDSNVNTNDQQLFYSLNSEWSEGEKALFRMSTTWSCFDRPISLLPSIGWAIPISGECKLFLRANSIQVVNEFCRIITYEIASSSADTFIDLFSNIDYTDYINYNCNVNEQNVNDRFRLNYQIGGTCYANAIAAVYFLSMRRIIGRENTPDFAAIRGDLIEKYSKCQGCGKTLSNCNCNIPPGISKASLQGGANTLNVLKESSSHYRLRFNKVDEVGARKALIKSRPVIATFRLSSTGWGQFSSFYRNNKSGILRDIDIDRSPDPDGGGHAVILIKCSPTHLTFCNSWGIDFADKGLFRVENSSVLHHMKFFDVFWLESDLLESEKQAYADSRNRTIENVYENITFINEIYRCSNCQVDNRIKDYLGDWNCVKCPKCNGEFTTENIHLKTFLYIRSNYVDGSHND
eukprot:gene16962-22456_t